MELKKTINAYWEAYSAHKIEDVLAFIDENVIIHFPTDPKPIQGKEKIGKVWSMVFEKVIPNQKVEVLSMIIQDNTVAVQLMETGTINIPQEALSAMNIPPADRSYKIPMASFIRFNSKGLIEYIYSYWDTGALSQQIGIDIAVIRSMQANAHGSK